MKKEGLCDSHPLHKPLCRSCPGGLRWQRRRYRKWRWRWSRKKPAVDMRTDFIWFKVEVPEGVEITDVAGDTADRAQFKFTESEHASDRFIPVFDSDKNADELFDYEAKWKANSGWTESDPVKYNGKTWRSAYFTHSGGVTTEYFTDVDGGSVYVRIDNVEEHKDAVETMMKSLEFADDIAEAKTEAMDVKLDDIEIKR